MTKIELFFEYSTKAKLTKRIFYQKLQEAVKKLNIKKNIIVNLYIVNKTVIKNLNKKYRKKNTITDVLSFPQFENLIQIKKTKGTVALGDIVVCYQQAFTQAKKFKIHLNEELIQLFLHGFLHLLGFDHIKNNKKWQKVSKIIHHEF